MCSNHLNHKICPLPKSFPSSRMELLCMSWEGPRSSEICPGFQPAAVIIKHTIATFHLLDGQTDRGTPSALRTRQVPAWQGSGVHVFSLTSCCTCPRQPGRAETPGRIIIHPQTPPHTSGGSTTHTRSVQCVPVPLTLSCVFSVSEPDGPGGSPQNPGVLQTAGDQVMLLLFFLSLSPSLCRALCRLSAGSLSSAHQLRALQPSCTQSGFMILISLRLQ